MDRRLVGVLVSHPKDFTPVCTTELGTMAGLKAEFDKRNAKVIAISVDPVTSHTKWSEDIRETQGHAPNYPMIGDPTLAISKMFGMLPANTEGTSEGRTAADNMTVRNVFVIGPDKKGEAVHCVSDDHGPQLRRGAARARFAAAHGQAQGGDAGQLEAGRRGHHRRVRVGRGCQEGVSGRLEIAEART
jgi:alkyl hydroperoxide reductase subunit AhpC